MPSHMVSQMDRPGPSVTHYYLTTQTGHFGGESRMKTYLVHFKGEEEGTPAMTVRGADSKDARRKAGLEMKKVKNFKTSVDKWCAKNVGKVVCQEGQSASAPRTKPKALAVPTEAPSVE